MTDQDILDKIAEEIGTITDEQDDDDSKEEPAREGEEFDPRDYERDKDDFDSTNDHFNPK